MRILLGRVKGDKGERGAQGPRGPQGERGPQGPPGEPGQTDIYTKAESDARYQLKGESIDFNELARRIPSWQWKVTLPKSDHQTVTATVGEQTYTDDFYAQQGSKVTFSAKADAGYFSGIVSPNSTTLTSDLTVTVTAAAEREEVEAGTKSFDGVMETFTVPPKVQVLKWTWDGKEIYTKVAPGKEFRITIMELESPYEEGRPTTFSYRVTNIESNGDDYAYVFSGTSSAPFSVAWSTEINEHAVDYDWTK